MTNKKIAVAILGSTGSIGVQTLQIIQNNSDKFSVELLACNTNNAVMAEQIAKFSPKIAVCATLSASSGGKTTIYNDLSVLNSADIYKNCDVVINGISGLGGLLPSIAVLQSEATLASANKESIVCGGAILQDIARRRNKIIVPVDSEHSALFQCIEKDYTKKLVLTASGGAFRDKTQQQLASVTAKEALHNPNWVMGKKVTIDSATLVNKALEVAEASHLFGISNIDVVIHRESIVHALVELADGSYKAVLSAPDMRLPIQYALTYPARLPSDIPSLDIGALGKLSFEKPDYDRFPCLNLGYLLLKKPYLGVAVCAADDIAVSRFLQDKISFYGIYELINKVLIKFDNVVPHTIDDIFSLDRDAHEYTLSLGNYGGSN